MNRLRNDGLPQVFIMVLLFVGASIAIFAKSLLQEHGYLSPDSRDYLALATNLKTDAIFSISNDGRPVAEKVYVATWPIGYPLLVASLSYILGVGVFVGSKILGVLVLGAAMLVVVQAFGRRQAALCAIFLFANTLEVFSYTWSEVPFIFFRLLLAYSLGVALGNSKTSYAGLCVLGFISAMGCFLSRYIGIFFVVPVGIVGATLFFKGKTKVALGIVLSAAAAASLCGAYLQYNQMAGGFATGVPRTAALETNAELADALFKTFVSEGAFPIVNWSPLNIKQSIFVFSWLLVGICLLVVLCRSPWRFPGKNELSSEIAFLVVGSTYLMAIIASRWVTQFDNFNIR